MSASEEFVKSLINWLRKIIATGPKNFEYLSTMKLGHDKVLHQYYLIPSELL